MNKNYTTLIICITFLITIFMVLIFMFFSKNELPYNITENKTQSEEQNSQKIEDYTNEKNEQQNKESGEWQAMDDGNPKSKLGASLGKTIFSDDPYAVINWAQKYIEVTGFGTAPENLSNNAQKIILAREGAVADAMRKISESVSEVIVQGVTNVKEGVVRNHFTGITVDHNLKKGLIPIGEYHYKEMSDGTIIGRVKYGYSFEGKNGLIAYLEDHPEFFEKTVEKYEEFKFDPAKNKSEIEDINNADYTGLIIDCSSFKLTSVVFAKIYTDNNGQVFKLTRPNPGSYLNGTSCRYTKSVKQAKELMLSNNKPAAGKNPLIIEAVGVIENTPLITVKDAVKVSALDSKINVLKSGNVIFVAP